MDDYLNHSIEWFRMITKIEFLRIRTDAIKHREELKAQILKDNCHTGLAHPLHPLYTRYNEIVSYYTCIHGVLMDISPEENKAGKRYEKEYRECFTEKIVEDEENYGHGILVCNECNQEFLSYRKAIDHYVVEHKEEETKRIKKKDDERALARENELAKNILAKMKKNYNKIAKEKEKEEKKAVKKKEREEKKIAKEKEKEDKRIAKLRKRENDRALVREEKSIIDALVREEKLVEKERKAALIEKEKIRKLRKKEEDNTLTREEKENEKALIEEERKEKRYLLREEKENKKITGEKERALAREEKSITDVLTKEEELAEKRREIILTENRKKLAKENAKKKKKEFAEKLAKENVDEMEKKLAWIELLEEKRIEDEIKEELLLKPWKDPDSLFCDTEFLERPVEEGGFGLKNVRIGDECK